MAAAGTRRSRTGALFNGVFRNAIIVAILCTLRPCLASWGYSGQYLYVWAGGDPDVPIAKDTLFVLSAKGANIGQVVNAVETPYKGTEPHHCGLSLDGNTLGCGGLLSLLTPGLPTVMFFNVKNRTSPVLYSNSQQPVLSANADDFHPTLQGGFMVTMMGSATGGSPGRVAVYDSKRNLVGEYPKDLKQLGAYPAFNPHGIDVDWLHNTMVTTDYVVPASTLDSVPGPVVFCNTTRLWNLATMSIIRTYDVSKYGGTAIMETRLVSPLGIYYVMTAEGFLFALDARDGYFTKVLELPAMDRPSGHGLMQTFRFYTRLLLSSFTPSKAYLIDTTNPFHPVILDTAYMGPNAGAHAVRVAPDERSCTVLTYFLDEGSVGKVQLPGDCTLHFFDINAAATKFTPNTVVDFKTLFPDRGTYRPHIGIYSA